VLSPVGSRSCRRVLTTLCPAAHRLSSIIDYDRLLVLDHGRLIEFDTPYALLTKEGGEDTAIFKGMCAKSGKWDELLRSAETKHQSSVAAGQGEKASA
jgi:ABC-type multidrug transport system ATPase subunit